MLYEVITIFCFAFLYFSRINPGDVTIFLTADHSIIFPIAIILLGAILVGLLLGNGVHILSLIGHTFTHWRRERKEKKVLEVGAIYREGVGRLLVITSYSIHYTKLYDSTSQQKK